MIDSYVFQVVKDILGPLYCKEQASLPRQVKFSPQFEQVYEIVRLDFEDVAVTELTANKYAEQLSSLVMLDVINSMNIDNFKNFADELFSSMWNISCGSILSYKPNVRNKVGKFGDKLLQGLFDEAIAKAIVTVKKQAYAIKTAEKLLECFDSTVALVDKGVIAYASDVAENAVLSGLNEVFCQNRFLLVVSRYAEETAHKVLKAFYSSAIQKHEKNKELTATKFASRMMSTLFEDVNCKSSPDLTNQSSRKVQNFCEELASGIMQSGCKGYTSIISSVTSTSSNAHLPETQKTVLKVSLNARPDNGLHETKLKSATNSLSSSLLAVNRRDSFDMSSEAITPQSGVDDAGWKKGLYQFADQLLYSLSRLEDEPHVSDVHATFDVADARVRRSGSCPHILRIPPTVYEVPAARRQSESIVRLAGGVAHYAENLAHSIMHSSFSEF